MTILERIKMICKEKKGIGLTALESILGYSNGSLSKAKDIPSSRIMEIANYLNVSIDFLMTGKEPEEDFSDEAAHLVAKIRKDTELSKALQKYFELSDAKKKHVVELINLLSVSYTHLTLPTT